MAASNGMAAAALGSQMRTTPKLASTSNALASNGRWYEIFKSTEEEKQIRQQMQEARRAALAKSEPEK
jgi:hypothetical protein